MNAGLAHIEDAPKDGGTLRLIVRRPRAKVVQSGTIRVGDLARKRG